MGSSHHRAQPPDASPEGFEKAVTMKETGMSCRRTDLAVVGEGQEVVAHQRQTRGVGLHRCGVEVREEAGPELGKLPVDAGACLALGWGLD